MIPDLIPDLILDLILDTNALLAVAADEVSAVTVFKTADSIALPVVVLGEYRLGILGSRRRTEYEKWLRELISLANVLDIDEQTSEHYARIRMELNQAGHQSLPMISGLQRCVGNMPSSF